MTNRKQVRQVSNSKTEKMIKKSFSVYDMTLIVISLLSYLLDIISGKKTVHQDKRKLKLSFVQFVFIFFFILNIIICCSFRTKILMFISQIS